MKLHLTEQELLEWFAGELNQAKEEHVASCLDCRTAVARFSDALGGFRATTLDWAEAARQEASRRPAARNKRFGWQGLRLAAALAVLLICFGLLLTRHKTPVAEMDGKADDAVLERVDAAMSRSVPTAMEPLSQLVPTEQQEKAGRAN